MTKSRKNEKQKPLPKAKAIAKAETHYLPEFYRANERNLLIALKAVELTLCRPVFEDGYWFLQTSEIADDVSALYDRIYGLESFLDTLDAPDVEDRAHG